MSQGTYIGRPCKHGHGGLRRRSNRTCVECERVAVRRFQATERGRAVLAEYKKSDARKAALKKYFQSDKGAATKRRYAGTEKQKAAYRRANSTIKSKLARALRDRVRKIWKRGKGNGARAGSAIRDLGCTVAHFKSHIEVQFRDGMSWANYGAWHLDHIKPLALFDLSDREQFLQAVHYTNCQPLWAADNWRKAANLLEAA
jgi:hypothetical protein